MQILDFLISLPLEKDSLEIFKQNEIVVFNHINSLDYENFFPNLYAAVLCTDGKAVGVIDDRPVTLEKNDIFFAHSDYFIQSIMTSVDFKCWGLIMTPEFTESIFLLKRNIWSARQILNSNPILHFNEQEAESFIHDCIFLSQKLRPPYGTHHKKMLDLLLQSLIYDLADCFDSKLAALSSSFSATEVLFNNFYESIIKNAPHHRELKYYADKLCITPKYLSSVCKQISGKTASSLINEISANKIRQMLLNSDLSIKEIAYESGFDNISFFGKYIKRELGMSPRQYRIENKKETDRRTL